MPGLRAPVWGEFPEWAVWTPGVSPSPCGTCSFTSDCVHSLRGVLTAWESARDGTAAFCPADLGVGGVRRRRPALGFVTTAGEVPGSNQLCAKRSRRKRFHFPGILVYCRLKKEVGSDLTAFLLRPFGRFYSTKQLQTYSQGIQIQI